MHGERLFCVGVVCTHRGCLLTELYAWGETVLCRDGMYTQRGCLLMELYAWGETVLCRGGLHTQRLSPDGAVCMGRDCFV